MRLARRLLLVAAVCLPLPCFAQTPTAPAVTETKIAPIAVYVTKPSNLRSLADAAGYDGHSGASFQFIVQAKTTILGKPGGGTAIDTGVWPKDVKLWLIIAGIVYGGGGNGGNGGKIPGPDEGGRGGDAIDAHAPITVIVVKGGNVKGGGGGGGGGSPAGGGGGGGFPNGIRGEAGADNTGFGQAGRYGTLAGGGAGGAGDLSNGGFPGGKGGDEAMAGESETRQGGAPGYAIRANGFAVPVANAGDIRGDVR